MDREESEKQLLIGIGVDPNADWTSEEREIIIEKIRRFGDLPSATEETKNQ
jgi:hypothetical protein